MVLDLGVSNQENTDFFNELGHKLRYDNFVRSLDESFGDGDFYVDPGEAARFALAAIVDGSPVPPPAARRSKDDWRAYCDARVR